jgi:hypothetical protein
MPAKWQFTMARSGIETTSASTHCRQQCILPSNTVHVPGIVRHSSNYPRQTPWENLSGRNCNKMLMHFPVKLTIFGRSWLFPKISTDRTVLQGITLGKLIKLWTIRCGLTVEISGLGGYEVWGRLSWVSFLMCTPDEGITYKSSSREHIIVRLYG